MLRRWCNRLRATLAADAVVVDLLRRDRRGRWIAIADESVGNVAAADLGDLINPLNEALQGLQAQGHALSGLRCEVAIADAWMIYEVIGSDLHDHPRRVADDLAAAALADTAGVASNELETRWQRQQRGRNLACALPLKALQDLQAVLAQHRVRLGQVRGEAVLAYNACLHALDAAPCVLAIVRPAGAQLAVLVDRAFVALRFEPGPSNPPALFESSRELLRSAGFDAGEDTKYFGDFASDAEWPALWRRVAAVERRRLPRRSLRLDLDLSPTRPTVAAVSWALLALGVVALLLGAMHFQSANRQHLREARNLQSLERALDEITGVRTTKASPEAARSLRVADEAVSELQVPWARLLAALEAAASPDVALLALEPSPQRHEIRLLAEAKSSAAMFEFLGSLSQQKLGEVVLVTHQSQGQTSAGTPVRFQVRVGWESR